MLTIVLTWIGAVLGLTLLVATAAGTLAVDFDEALQERRSKTAKVLPGPTGPVS